MVDPGYIVQSAGDKGKGLFATREFKSGAVIFEELPLVSCQFPWNADYGYSACDHCLRPLETAEENARRLSMKADLVLPFPECASAKKENHILCQLCGANYCSIQCQETAWNHYHKTVCYNTYERNSSHPLEKLKEMWKQIHYPPETATIFLLVRMVAIVQQAEDKGKMLGAFMQFCHRSVNEDKDAAHKLLGEKFANDIEKLRETFKKAINPEHVEQWITPDGFISLLALVGTNGQGIGTSAFSEWVKNVNDLPLSDSDKETLNDMIDKLYDDFDACVGDFLNNDGSGLYELQSACNHSCTPNAESNFPYNNHTLVLKATSDIQPGEEICVSYLEECLLERSRHTRQKILRTNYLFDCTCPKCLEQAGDADESSEEEEEEVMESDD